MEANLYPENKDIPKNYESCTIQIDLETAQ